MTGASGLGTWGIAWGSTKDDGKHWLRKTYQTIKEKSTENSALAVKLNPIFFKNDSNGRDAKTDITFSKQCEIGGNSDTKLKISDLKKIENSNGCSITTYKGEYRYDSNYWVTFKNSSHKNVPKMKVISIILVNKFLKDSDQNIKDKDKLLNHLKNYVEQWNDNPGKYKRDFWFLINEKAGESSLIKNEDKAQDLLKDSSKSEKYEEIMKLPELKNISINLRELTRNSRASIKNFKENDESWFTYVDMNKSG